MKTRGLACGRSRCPICPIPFLNAIPEDRIEKLESSPPPKIKKVLRNRGAIANIIPLDVDEASSSWAIGSQEDRN
jgi:hypothetical protein